MMNPVVFLDRDGVVNQDSPSYIKTPEEFHFIPKSPEAIALLCDNGFDVILITNQSAVGRKWITQDTLNAIFDKLSCGVEAAGGRITDILYCPHTPDEGCDCRKPKPGLIREACRRHAIDPAQSVMVGDSAKDILCARAAGCGTTVLVSTGNGSRARADLAREGIVPDRWAKDLYEAALWIIDTVHHDHR